MAADTAVNCGANNGGPQVAMHMGKPNGQYPRTNPGPSPGPGPRGQMQITGEGKRRATRCYHCQKVGHMRKDCWHYKNKQSKAQSGKGKATETKKPNNNGGGNYLGSGNNPAGAMGYMRLTADAGCNDDSSSSSSSSEDELSLKKITSMKKSKASFQVWNGGITHNEMCGKVLLKALNALRGGETTLELDKVEYSLTGPVNLLSNELMVSNDWELSTSAPGVLPKKL
ncbi:hypothetical protein GN958_ATG10009 [Phytophthora infestans]|uniref:CCHC-type domain-containing protein n=1 Tax=Phytophthora infestans TaxID=4787 RepID=A0A8S9UJ61_PHYIN|nr:hypothetical protein GN958_ATG10009 [Phytophthora infestans]